MILGLVYGIFSNLQAADHTPLLMEGKKTLYQRILSTPDARIYVNPELSQDSTEVTPFSVLYVYARRDGWIRVGFDSFGNTAGWMQQDAAIV